MVRRAVLGVSFSVCMAVAALGQSPGAIERGEILVEMGRYADAKRQFESALTVDPQNSVARYRLAEVLFLERDWERASQEFRASIEGGQAPIWTVAWAHINLGKILDGAGLREQALREYAAAIGIEDAPQSAVDYAKRLSKRPYQPRRQAAAIQ